MESLDIVVVGAGMHGASVAYSLASRGHKPRVYERGPVAGGPTARSGAICRAYYTNVSEKLWGAELPRVWCFLAPRLSFPSQAAFVTRAPRTCIAATTARTRC